MKYKIYFGGWYQRTTLHLSEIYDFMHRGHSNLPLDKSSLEKNYNNLNIKSVVRKNDYLEYIYSETNDNINIKYFEDGLYVLETDSDEIGLAKEKLEKYFSEKFNPSISYIFSLGAPTPKILANIKQDHPLVIAVETKDHPKYKVEERFGEVYSVVESSKFTVYKTPKYIIIAVDPKSKKEISNLVYMQIFFREFKDQLEKYLNIHRRIWEEITLIKDAGSIKGSQIIKNRMKLDSYDRSINLINNRINQMGTYVKTRQSISKDLGVEEHLVKIFDYKFETLVNTLSYIKEIWSMTRDYVKNVTSILSDIENQSLNNSIKSLQIITSIGVVSGILGYLSKSDLPRVTPAGIEYLFLLIVITFTINLLIVGYYRSIKYKIKISDTNHNL